jgi:hypothetical protein
MPLPRRPEAFEALDELANWRQLSRPGETRRKAVLALDRGVLTASVIGPLEAFEGDLEVAIASGPGCKPSVRMRLTNRSTRCTRLRRRYGRQSGSSS